MIKTVKYGANNDILIAPELAFGLSVIVSNTGVDAVDGKKIIAAGTPLYASADVLTERSTKMVASKESEEVCYGVARHDIDVTDGDANATLLIAGYVDLDMLDDTTAGKINAEIKTALPLVKFIKGGI